MPVTGTLGALTYSRSTLGDQDWALHVYNTDVSGNGPNFAAMVNNGGNLFMSGQYNYPISSFPDNSNDACILKINTDVVPRLSWCNELNPFVLKYNVTSVNGVTEYFSVSSPLDLSNFTVNTVVRFYGSVFGGANVVAEQRYYVKDVSGSFQFQVSNVPGGPALNIVSSSGNMTVVANKPDKSSGPLTPTSLKISQYNNNLYTTGFFNTITPDVFTVAGNGIYGDTTIVNDSGNIVSSFKNSKNVQNTLNPTDPTWITYDSEPLSSNSFVTTSTYIALNGNTANSIAGNTFNTITKVTGNTIDWQVQQQIKTTTGPVVYPTLIKQTSTGNIINIAPLPTQTISWGASYNANIHSLDPTNGSTNYRVEIRNDDSIFGTSYEIGGVTTSAVIDSNNNLFIVSKEVISRTPYNTFGSFIIKLNSSGVVLWQNHYVLSSTTTTQFETVLVDSSDDLYLVGRLLDNEGLAVCKIDGSTGSQIWTNKIDITNDTKLAPKSICINDDYLFVMSKIWGSPTGGSESLPKGAVIYKLPKDGSIPGDGTYSILNSISDYVMTYATANLTVATSNVKVLSPATGNLSAYTSISNTAVYTTSTGNITVFPNVLT